MIPNKLNPHGLEDRLVTYHVIRNDDEVWSYTDTCRRYCYLTIPPSI